MPDTIPFTPLNTDQISQIRAAQEAALNAATQQPTANLAQTEAETGAAGASAQASEESAESTKLQIQQKQLISNYGDQLDKATDPKTGYVSPQTYNTIKKQAVSAGVGITSDQFDQQFEHNYTDPTRIDYNTSGGFANRSAAGEITRQIQSQLDQFNSIPADQKGLFGKANIVNQNPGQVLASSPSSLSDLLDSYKMGKDNYLATNAPDALGYQKSTAGLAAQLKGLIGGSGLRVTQPELNNWMSLLPGPEDTPQVVNKKLSELDGSLKATFHTDMGLDPKYLPNANISTPTPTTGGSLLNKGLDDILNVALPTGGAVAGGGIGALLGALVPGADATGVPEVAGAIGGSSVGGGAGQALADFLSGKKPGADVAVTAALSGAGEGAGAGLGALLGKTGSAVGDYGTSLISKNLNLTPKMSSDVAKDMGVKSISDFLSKEGLQGANYEKVATAAEPIQTKFDAIANDPNLKIDPGKIVDGFDKQIKQLQTSILPSDQAKAKVLDQIGSNFIDRFGDQTSVGADQITALRRQVDTGVKDFGADPLVASAGNLTRNILQKSIQDSDTTSTLKPLGQKLNQYYTLLSKAEPRQFASTGKPLLSAKDAITGFIGNMFGGPPAAAAGIGLEKILGSAPGTKAVSKGAITLGNILKSGALQKTLSTGGAIAGSGLGAILGL